MAYKNIFSLKEKVIIVTGGCGLIGRQFCKGIAEYEGSVIIADNNLESAKLLADEIKSEGGYAEACYLDITSKESVSELISYLDTKYRKIDGLVNNAYPRNKKYGTKFEDIELESWKENVDLHLNGYFNVTQQIAKYMSEQKSGVIVNMSSIYGLLGPDFSIYEGTPMTMPAEYAAIKGAIVNFSRYLSNYLAKDNIRVNTLSPGGVFDHQPEAFVEKYGERTPLGRMANPNEMVGGLIFLLSDASSFVTGHNLLIDGGWSSK